MTLSSLSAAPAIAARFASPIHAQRIGDEISAQCTSMPEDTFEWASAIVYKHECAQKGLEFLSRHMSSIAVQHKDADVVLANATDLASLVGTAVKTTPSWSQPEACNMVAHVATCVAKMMMIGSALAHLFLFLSAAAVVKRACCLRCFAFKCGLLRLSKCGACKGKYVCKPEAVMMPRG